MLTILELLNSNYFKRDVQLIAGSSGIKRKISWAANIEHNSFNDAYIKDNEFVFSTGISFANYNSSNDFLLKLISSNCSGICIESSVYDVKISDKTLDICNQNHFVVIESRGILPIDKIIQFINESVLSDEYQSFAEGEHFYQRLLEFSENEIVDKIKINKEHNLRNKEHFSWDLTQCYVDFVASYLNAEIYYFHIMSPPIVSFNATKSPKNIFSVDILSAIDTIEESDVHIDGNIAYSKITVLSEKYAYIGFAFNESINRHQMYIINRFSSFMRATLASAFVENVQRKHIIDSQWLHNWFSGKMSTNSVKDKLKQINLNFETKGYFVVLVDLTKYSFTSQIQKTNKYAMNHLATKISITMFRSFNKHGLKTIEYFGNGYLIHLVIVPKNAIDYNYEIRKSLDSISANCDSLKKHKDLRIAVGKFANEINGVMESYRTAKLCSEIKTINDKQIIIYKDLGIYRIIEQLHNNYESQDYITDVLGPLMYESNRELLETLKIYFSCKFSKLETCSRMFIARQTLYNRLDKIKEYLGSDFDSGDKQLSIGLALKLIEIENKMGI